MRIFLPHVLLGIAVASALAACVGDAGRDEVARLASPDGTLDAVLSESGGGHPEAFDYHVHVVPLAPTSR